MVYICWHFPQLCRYFSDCNHYDCAHVLTVKYLKIHGFSENLRIIISSYANDISLSIARDMKNVRDSVALYNYLFTCFNVLTIKLQINLFSLGWGDKIFQEKKPKNIWTLWHSIAKIIFIFPKQYRNCLFYFLNSLTKMDYTSFTDMIDNF